MSYDKTKLNQENCNCEECVSNETVKSENQIIVEYPKLSEEEIERIIDERYSDKNEKTKIFIRKALRKHGDRYDYFNVNYINAHTKIEIICRVEGHKPFLIAPFKHTDRKHGCSICGGKRRLTTEEFIKRANKIHGEGTYDYSKVKYINMSSEVIITCSKHGDFPQTPQTHLHGGGCKLCGIEKRANKRKITFEEFIKRARKIHGNKYDYSKAEYENVTTPIIIICPKHKPFKQTPENHMQGQGCPSCNESKGEMKIRIFLTSNNIEFEREKRFDDCKNKKSLPFDFYVPTYNLCIEFDGEQHFIPHSFKFKKENEDIKLENLKLVQKRDQIKNDYCKEKGINLLRIRYDENVEEKLTEYFQNHEYIKD
jgi:very-short-patch-repair endonuclease